MTDALPRGSRHTNGGTHHAHWDCARGVSEGTILLGCLRALLQRREAAPAPRRTSSSRGDSTATTGATTSTADLGGGGAGGGRDGSGSPRRERRQRSRGPARPLAERLQEFRAQVAPLFHAVLGVPDTCLVLSLSEASAPAIDAIAVEPAASWPRDDRETVQKVAKRLARCKNLSSWAREVALAAIKELQRLPERAEAAEPPGEAAAIPERRDGLDQVVAWITALWCLDRCQVRSASYSPLPVSAGSLAAGGALPSLLRGMTVLPATKPDICVTVPAAIFLKALTASTGNRVRAMALESAKYNTLVGMDGRIVTTALLIGRLPSQFTETLEPSGSPRVSTGTTDAPATPRKAPSEEPPEPWQTEPMLHLETNIDDMTGEYLAHCQARLLAVGAADAWTTAMVMKKGRPGVTLHCLGRARQRAVLLTELFRHSTTLGVRVQSVERVSLRREKISVQTDWKGSSRGGLVDVKVGYLGEEVVSIKAEYDHCNVISMETNTPIQTVAEQAVRKARQQLDDDLEALVKLVSPISL